jgi:hypothetical protein
VSLPRSGSDRIRTALGRVDPRVEWPHGLVRLGVAGCVAVAVALGLVYFVRAVDRLGGDASRNAAASFDDRELGGGAALGIDPEALYVARSWIPKDGSYRFVAAPNAVGGTAEFVQFFLMPRRVEQDARWVFCYRCDLARVGGDVQVVWQNDAGIAVGRVGG